jgi:hypothetical protein
MSEREKVASEETHASTSQSRSGASSVGPSSKIGAECDCLGEVGGERRGRGHRNRATYDAAEEPSGAPLAASRIPLWPGWCIFCNFRRFRRPPGGSSRTRRARRQACPLTSPLSSLPASLLPLLLDRRISSHACPRRTPSSAPSSPAPTPTPTPLTFLPPLPPTVMITLHHPLERPADARAPDAAAA